MSQTSWMGLSLRGSEGRRCWSIADIMDGTVMKVEDAGALKRSWMGLLCEEHWRWDVEEVMDGSLV